MLIYKSQQYLLYCFMSAQLLFSKNQNRYLVMRYKKIYLVIVLTMTKYYNYIYNFTINSIIEQSKHIDTSTHPYGNANTSWFPIHLIL